MPRLILHSTTGFTLLELLIVLVIAGVAGAIGAPPLADWAAAQRLRAELTALERGFQHARQQAVLRQYDVVICPSANGERCAVDGAWSAGWISFVNRDGDSPPARDADEPILAAHRLPPSVVLVANRRYYRLRGDLRRATNGRLTLCDRAGRVAARSLVVSYSGRARSNAAPGAADACR